MSCAVAGCENPFIHCRAMCGMHYHRARRAGLSPQGAGICAWVECDLRAVARDLCPTHMNAWWESRHPQVGRPKPEPRGCKAPGCVSAHASMGYCHRHYNVLARPVCTAGGCANKRKYRTGLCLKHEKRRRLQAAPVLAMPRKVRNCPWCPRGWHDLPADASPISSLPWAACPGSSVPAREGVSA